MKRMVFILASCMMLFGCFPVKHGLTPISPSDGATVDSLKPTFSWQPYTDVKDGKENIRYKIFIKDDSTIVEAKGDIHNTSYTAEYQLLPNKKYNWCVLPTWTRDNHTEIGQCNYKQYYYFALVVFGRTGASPYTFKTPEKGIEKVKEVSSDKPSQKDDSTRLEKLKNMRDGGLITQEEYDTKRKEILDAM